MNNPKANFEIPAIEIIKFTCEDVITESGIGDANQGEWDPQLID